MAQQAGVSRARLRTPKAAAVAGVIFSILLIAIFWLLRSSLPADPMEPGTWLAGNTAPATLALNLIPFAGIAFLWFIGVLRDRLGQLEDRFFATVFFGSSLLFIGLLFVAATLVGALVVLSQFHESHDAMSITTFRFGRAAAYILVNIYAIKMGAVFMISTSTVIIYTRIVPRWIAVTGYALALLLLIGSYGPNWSVLVLPVWVLLVSVHILLDEFRRAGEPPTLAGPADQIRP